MKVPHATRATLQRYNDRGTGSSKFWRERFLNGRARYLKIVGSPSCFLCYPYMFRCIPTAGHDRIVHPGHVEVLTFSTRKKSKYFQ